MKKLQKPTSKEVWWIEFGRGNRELYHHQGNLPEVSARVWEMFRFKYNQDMERKKNRMM